MDAKSEGPASVASIDPASCPMPRAPTILVFDSGVGGLSVFRELARVRPDARFVYAADDAAFPYGHLTESALVARVVTVMDRLVVRHAPDLAVIACNTASTLVLPPLRARFAFPLVGTVPAIKPAAEATRSGLISVLATPGTVARDYTHDLVRAHAAGCRVALVGSTGLAGAAEAELKGEPVADAVIAAEIAPCFNEEGGARTDAVVLGCTHYPLLLERLRALAPWPVTWIDPAPAIARRVTSLLGEAAAGGTTPAREGLAVFTSGAGLSPSLRAALSRYGLPRVETEALPLALAA